MFRFSALSIIAGIAIAPVFAQGPAIRITRAVKDSELQTLPRNVHPLARAEFDRGPAPADLPMDRMLLVLTPSAEQQAELTSLLDAQQNPASPQFRQWLTPEEFGARFGPADQDIQTLTTWLAQQGFTVNRVSKGKTIVEFSGTAGQVKQAFHAEIHKYVVNGEEHWANASDPQIPAALAPVVAGVATMHNFLKKSMLSGAPQKFEATLDANGKPQFTSSTGTHALSPGDYWKIYNVQQPPGPPNIGVAIVGRSNINTSDVKYFENYFLYSYIAPAVIVNGVDPGDLGGGEEGEAVLDTSWALATSRGPVSPVYLVVSKTTNTTDGVDLSEEYIIDKNIGGVMSESFGSCEANYTEAQAAFYSFLAQQAAAQGITYLVAAGDSGSSGCDLGSDAYSDGSLSVNLLAANPYVTAVGGTEFNENGNDSTYWAASNSSTGGSNYVSALSYIPEVAWNESCTPSEGVNPCTSGYSPGLWAGGGGASQFYSKPSWQTGVPGIPNDGARDIPDISLTAAGHDPYLLCLDGSCTPNSTGRISFYGYAGTSAATPSFAGFIADWGRQIQGRLGNINPLLYSLAAKESLGICNGSNSASPPVTNCIFNDVTVGNNSVPGEPGYNTSSGTYQAAVGYDLATGLGSVNQGNLAAGIAFPGGTPKLTLSASTLDFGTVNLGSSKSLNIIVMNTGTGILSVSQFSYLPQWSAYSSTGCATAVFPGQSCTLSFTFTPTVDGTVTAFPIVVANTTPISYNSVSLTGTGVGALPAPPTSPMLSTTGIGFGTQKVGARSAAQIITITNPTGQTANTSSISLTGPNPYDFAMGTNCGSALASGSSCSIYVLFTPALAGNRKASVSIAGIGNVSLTGTASLSGYFVLYNAGTGQVLDFPSGSSGNGTLVQQDTFNADRLQRWTFIPNGDGSYAIQNSGTGRVLDVTGGSKSNGAFVQEYDYLSGDPNQQWILTPIDDVHYSIINVNSGRALDIPGGTRQDGTVVQQWDYLGSPQQLWVLLSVTTYNISSEVSSLPLDVVGASTSDGAQVEQATPNGSRDQQWELVPTGGGYYAILNRLSGKVLDNTASSTSDGNPMQQYDYLSGTNQQWQVVPVDASNYKLINRQSGKALDDTGSSTSSGTLIQQWDYSGGRNQLWQLTAVTYYNIQNAYSGLVLDVPGGSTSSGQTIQQWAANGAEQQEWAVVEVGQGESIIINNATSKALDATGSSTSNSAQIDQTTFSSAASQMWSLFQQRNGYGILNAESAKALDDTASSLANGNTMQQYDYLGSPNQQWKLVSAIP